MNQEILVRFKKDLENLPAFFKQMINDLILFISGYLKQNINLKWNDYLTKEKLDKSLDEIESELIWFQLSGISSSEALFFLKRKDAQKLGIKVKRETLAVTLDPYFNIIDSIPFPTINSLELGALQIIIPMFEKIGLIIFEEDGRIQFNVSKIESLDNEFKSSLDLLITKISYQIETVKNSLKNNQILIINNNPNLYLTQEWLRSVGIKFRVFILEGVPKNGSNQTSLMSIYEVDSDYFEELNNSFMEKKEFEDFPKIIFNLGDINMRNAKNIYYELRGLYPEDNNRYPINTFGNMMEEILRKGNQNIQELANKYNFKIKLEVAQVPKFKEKPIDQIAEQAAIGLITALPLEFAAVKCILENYVEVNLPGEGSGRKYIYGQVSNKYKGKNHIILALSGMGNNQASIRATLLLERFPNIKSIIMLGIAGGVPYPEEPEHHVRLGDIVVSDQGGVIQYDFNVETLDKIVPRFQPRPPSASLLEAVNFLKVSEIEGYRPWDVYIKLYMEKLRFDKPDSSQDVLFSSINTNEIVEHPFDKNRHDGVPRVFYGTIASANKLLKNPVKRDNLRDQFNVRAIEMEGSGIADATWNQDRGYLIVRGICDYCDENKNDLWQKYSAVVSAAYVRALLENYSD